MNERLHGDCYNNGLFHPISVLCLWCRYGSRMMAFLIFRNASDHFQLIREKNEKKSSYDIVVSRRILLSWPPLFIDWAEKRDWVVGAARDAEFEMRLKTANHNIMRVTLIPEATILSHSSVSCSWVAAAVILHLSFNVDFLVIPVWDFPSSLIHRSCLLLPLMSVVFNVLAPFL